jgi:hypothetical protein
MPKSVFCGRDEELACLKREWRLVTEADGHPQVLVLLADNGLGKTRLVQEFFGWLSTTDDPAGDNGYWPDELEATGDNLRVNPGQRRPRARRPSVSSGRAWKSAARWPGNSIRRRRGAISR